MTLVQTRVKLKLEQTQQKQQDVYLKHQPMQGWLNQLLLKGKRFE
jgi:hypothetical protein